MLSRLEYDLCWEHLRLGEQPTALAIPGHGGTMDERRELLHHAWRALGERGLTDRGDLDPVLAERLRILSRPELELDARLRLDQHGPRTRAMGASHDGTAVVAVLTPDHLVLDPVDPTRLADALVGLLPAAPLPRSRSITMPGELLDRAAASPARMEHVLREGRLTAQDARQVCSVLGSVVAMGQFGAAHRRHHQGHPGPRRRASYVVSFYDTPEGRWQFTRRRGWATLAPADHPRLTSAVTELLADTT